MSFYFSIGEALSRVEDDVLCMYVNEKIHDGAPWYETRRGWVTWSDNAMSLNNRGTSDLMINVVPELFTLSYSNGYGSGIINITPQVVGIITNRLNYYKSLISVKPYAYHPDINVHWAGVLEWMRWWCDFCLKKCDYPIITYG